MTMDNPNTPNRTKTSDLVRSRISEGMNRPKIVDDIKAVNKEKMSMKMQWSGEIRRHWFIYLFLAVSSIFTITLGLFMGLSPELQTDPTTGITNIYWHTDTGHVLLAIIYAVTFWIVTEVAFAVCKLLYSQREEGNPSQAISMIVGMVVGLIGIIGTGIAGGFIIASNIAFLSDFREIPHNAQLWVVVIIPTMIAIYAALFVIYTQSSEHEAAERAMRDQERTMRLNTRTAMNQAMLVAQDQLNTEKIASLFDWVDAGKISLGDVESVLSGKRTIEQLEKDRNLDLNRDGFIGDVGENKSPALPARSALPGPSSTPAQSANRGDHWTALRFLRYINMSPEDLFEWLYTNTLYDKNSAFAALKNSGYIPDNMTAVNFGMIYDEIYIPPSVPNTVGRNPGPLTMPTYHQVAMDPQPKSGNGSSPS